MNNPEYVQIDDKKYKINTDYRNVLKLNDIANDTSISDYEKMITYVYLFFGEEGLKDENNYGRLVNSIITFAKGRPSAMKPSINDKQEKDMDYTQDMNLIISSIWSEYGIDITKEKIHWWTFFDLLNGLSSDCALNKVRDIRSKDINKIKDKEERDEYIKLKEVWALDKTKEMTPEQKKSVDDFYKDFIS